MRAAWNKRKLAAERRVLGGGRASRLGKLEEMAFGLLILFWTFFFVFFLYSPKPHEKRWARCYYPHYIGGKFQEQYISCPRQKICPIF